MGIKDKAKKLFQKDKSKTKKEDEFKTVENPKEISEETDKEKAQSQEDNAVEESSSETETTEATQTETSKKQTKGAPITKFMVVKELPMVAAEVGKAKDGSEIILITVEEAVQQNNQMLREILSELKK